MSASLGLLGLLGLPADSALLSVTRFFNVLFDRLETLLKGSPQEKLLDYCFGGKVVNQLICQECPARRETAEHYYILSLEVKNKKNIQESLQLYVQGERLEGDNKYHCDQCKVSEAARTALRLDLLCSFVMTMTEKSGHGEADVHQGLAAESDPAPEAVRVGL